MTDTTTPALPPFEFPKIYSFPPLYTEQPNTTIQSQQLDSWTSIILQYCQYYKITSLTLDLVPKHLQYTHLSLSELPSLFVNKAINRQVGPEFQKKIIAHLLHLNKAVFVNPKKPQFGIFVLWKSLVEWGNELYSYVDELGQKGTVLTIYELTKSDDEDGGGIGVPDSLVNLDEAFLIRIIRDYLIKQGKAQLLIDENNEIGGVKIV
ncbi:Vacuolar protein-sorting-associated protein 25 [Candida viswanathii]|uniref:Vacuolar protein-sorting-associated protein 25 n=1 Tax=Candida viswanathii TaxID=5486 RepID=A0A367YHJ7_9ASCO|nr:Vacuolar protein-sorting-associated protein 25 [Candida viswanathii]